MNQGIAELVGRIQDGEKQWMTQLWEAFSPLWMKWARITDLTGYEKEDLYQQSYLILEDMVKSFDAERGVPFEGYYQLGLKRWRLTQYRRLQERMYTVGGEVDESLVDETINVEEEALTHTLMIQVEHYLEALTAEEQILLRGFYLEHRSIGELADQLQISYKSAEKKKIKGLEELRKKVNEK